MKKIKKFLNDLTDEQIAFAAGFVWATALWLTIILLTSCGTPVKVLDTNRERKKLIVSALCISKFEISEDGTYGTLKIPLDDPPCTDFDRDEAKTLPLSLGVIKDGDYWLTMPLSEWEDQEEELVRRGILS